MVEEENNKINKLIIIGNGFDLSLGLKTSYQDFLIWMLQKYIKKAYEYKEHLAPYPQYQDYGRFGHENKHKHVNGFFSNQHFDILIEYNAEMYRMYSDSIFKSVEKIKSLEKEKVLQLNFKNSLGILSTIIQENDFKWVDIEGIYFGLVKRYFHQTQSHSNTISLDELKKRVKGLNTELDFLSEELKEYLKEIQEKAKKLQMDEHKSQFESPLFRKSLQNKSEAFDPVFPFKTYFLNFNYTNTIKNYVIEIDSINILLNNIHGTIDSEIIFGYGDEMDKIYKEIEELNDNVFFQHIKSFHYFKRPEFRQLLAFLDSNKFQVCIYGHSCGLSDRVLLNEIFEHDNCESIRIYHLGQEDYFNKTMDISRHFNSNKLLRRKIVNYSEEDRIPQVGGE